MWRNYGAPGFKRWGEARAAERALAGRMGIWVRSMLMHRMCEPRRAALMGGERVCAAGAEAVSYTHLTLPTNREV